MFNRKLVRTVQSAILLAALRTSFDKKKMLKLVFCRHFRVLKCLTFKMRLKSFALGPRPGQLENGLFDILWATLVGV